MARKPFEIIEKVCLYTFVELQKSYLNLSVNSGILCKDWDTKP
jgi:hypothetical protein